MKDMECLQRLLALAGPRTVLTLVEGTVHTLSWSCDELQQQRRYVERVLLAEGLAAGDRVLVSTANNPQCFAILLAAISLQLCLMPLHPDFSSQQLQALLEAQTPRLVIVDDPHRMLAFGETTVLQIRERAAEWLQPLIAGAALTSASAEVTAQTNADPPLLLFHSSGSTGQPKGMRFTRSMLNNYLWKLHELYGAFPDKPVSDSYSDRVNVLPVTHFGGLSFCLLAMLEGRCLHLLRSHDARDHLALLRKLRCQLVLLVPALWQELLSGDTGNALPDLRHCLAMGESISHSQLQQLSARLALPVHNAYGMSECLTGIYNTAALIEPPGSCGRLHFGEAKLLAADGSENQSEGELCVRNITTIPCYTSEELNFRKYRDGWFHTGDLFRRDMDGFYFFVSRADLMCVINGRNVYPQEVELILREHPSIHFCIAAPIQLEDGRQRLAAAVELAAGASVTANALVDFYLQRGAVYATPVWVQFFAALPRNGGDKPDRARCRHLLQLGYSLSRQLAPAGTNA